jgi:site-specific recombinase XerC
VAEVSAKNYAAKNRRRMPVNRLEGYTPQTRFTAPTITPAAAEPTVRPRPHGELDDADPDKIATAITYAWPNRCWDAHKHYLTGAGLLLEHLAQFDGETWQQRWIAAGLDGPEPRRVRDLREPADDRLTTGARTLFCLRIIQPSLIGFRANKFGRYPEAFHEAQQDELLDAFFQRVHAHTAMSHAHRRTALFDVCCALTTQGIALADLTPAALLHHAYESRRLRVVRGGKSDHDRFAGVAAWTILHEMGHFPPGTPSSMRATLMRGQLTMEEMVDRYGIRDQGVRQLLIDYLDRRRAEADYGSIANLSRHLAGLFWAKIETINPGQTSLHIDSATYDQWRAELNVLANGKPRNDCDAPLLAVRGFYLDLASWALQEPERWAHWVAPCPIPTRDLRGYKVRRRRVKERMDGRTRVRQPLLPALIEHVDQQMERWVGLLGAARQVGPGEEFVHDGQQWQRTNSDYDRAHLVHDGQVPVRATNLATGVTHNIETEDDQAFWLWATVIILRHTGVRIEELVELTHLSIRQYQRANGEVIGLLVIAPSKTDRERVIPMSPEVFHAVAMIIRRLTAGGRTIPLLSRYDEHERLWSEPLPFLFQRRNGSVVNVVSKNGINKTLIRLCNQLGETNKAFAGIRFTPHDFRRLLATELVNSGLPIHIGAALLGHLDVQTTRGYVAVFDEQVVSHYQKFLAHRRSLRPDEEYREVSAEEWTEFEEHFDKRKVELGGCNRPYGTGCEHEHACIRCPMLVVNPKMLPRLGEIETDLLARRARAEAEGWIGEIDGIDLTLTLLRQKRQDTERLLRRTTDLGIPRFNGTVNP